MKKIGCLLCVVGLLLDLGTVGAAEMGSIPLIKFMLQVIIGLFLFIIGYCMTT